MGLPVCTWDPSMTLGLEILKCSIDTDLNHFSISSNDIFDHVKCFCSLHREFEMTKKLPVQGLSDVIFNFYKVEQQCC